MRLVAVLPIAIVLAAGPGADAQAQSCSGNVIDQFERRCKADFIELEERYGRVRVYDGQSRCFAPLSGNTWRWHCRGFEEGSRCRTKSTQEPEVQVSVDRGVVRWVCYGRY